MAVFETPHRAADKRRRSPLLLLPTTMPTELPYAADAEDSLSYDELEVRCNSLLCSGVALNENLSLEQVLRAQYEKEAGQAHITTQTKFNYAWGLVKSPVHEHQIDGIRLFTGLSSPDGSCSRPDVLTWFHIRQIEQIFTVPSQQGAENVSTTSPWVITS